MSMKDREKAFETKFAHDQEKLFRIESRACRLLGQWAAEQLGLSGSDAETYAKSVIASNMDEPGFGDVVSKVFKDFEAKNLGVGQDKIESALEKNLEIAAEQIQAE